MATIEDSFKHQLSRSTSSNPTTNESTKAGSQAACLRSLSSDTHILAGNVGDHRLVLQLLIQANRTSLSEDFQSRLDEPTYSPSDRLLLQHLGQLIGHVHVSKLIGWFNGQRCPLARLQDFVTLPEYRSKGFDAPFLQLAESVAADEGSVLGYVRTDRPEWFEQCGWSRCRGQGHTRANTRAILSHLDAQTVNRRSGKHSIEVRTWRHYELDSLVKIHQQLTTHTWGSLYRSLDMWQWLVGRKAHDQILIALEKTDHKGDAGPDDSDLRHPPEIICYAIVRDSCIIEMLTLPGHASVRSQLLAQACRDAIDRDHHFVSLHTPTADPLHELLVTAGGSWIPDTADAGGQTMLKLLAPDRWIDRLYPVLHERAREAGVPRPLEVDFAVGDQLQRFTLTRRSARLESITRSQAPIQCSWITLQNVLIGNLTYPEAIAQGKLRTPHLSLLRILAALFPPKLFWQSPFPLLRL